MTLAWEDVARRARPCSEVRDNGTNHASSLWKALACLRRAYYDRVYGVSEASDASTLTMEHGTVVGQLVCDYFKRAGLWRGDEVRGGSARHNLTYRIDVLAADGDAVVPVEVKSVNAKKFDVVKECGPYEEHVVQLQCYMHFHRPEPYPYGYLLYYNRCTDEVLMLRLNYDAEAGARIESALTFLEAHVETGITPEAARGAVCRFCEHKRRCENDK